jgi:RNA polymerase sigma-70 factor, ECF subfamily
MAMPTTDSDETRELLGQAAAGDPDSWGALLTRHQDRLRRVVAFRLDPRLRARIDPSDVLQDVFAEAAQNRASYLARRDLPFFLWLRGIAGNKLLELHRHHLGTQMRDARREVSLHPSGLPETTSAALAAQLLGHATGPSEAAVRAEARLRLQAALNGMDPLDREVLALRHFEQLSPNETAQVLGIKTKTAGSRYLRALKKLREILAGLPGNEGEIRL